MVESLEILDPILDTNDENKFEPLYDAISKSKTLKNLKLESAQIIFFREFQEEINDDSIFPKGGIEKLVNSSVKTITVISGSNWDDAMSHVLGDNFERLTVESLAINYPVLISDDFKFEKLYDAISKSTKIKNLKLEGAQIKIGESQDEIIDECIFPTRGIEKLVNSNIKTLSFYYDHFDFESPLETILNGLPHNLEELEVLFEKLTKKVHSDSLDSTMSGIFRAIFTKAPNLKRLSIHGIILDGGVDDFEFLAESIRSMKLKSLTLNDLPVTDINAFKTISNSLYNSKIEYLDLSEMGIVFSGGPVNELIKVLPRMKFLKNLCINEENTLKNTEIFTEFVRTLKLVNITSLSLSSAKLDDNAAFILAKMIPRSKLKRLDVRFNRLSQKGIIALENAINSRPGFKLEITPQEPLIRKRKRLEELHRFL